MVLYRVIFQKDETLLLFVMKQIHHPSISGIPAILFLLLVTTQNHTASIQYWDHDTEIQ